MTNRVYLDYSATTPTKPAVVEAMLPYYGEIFGNPSSVHAFGRQAKHLITEARDTIAQTINASRDELYFTAGGTESDNWAVWGVMRANAKKGKHFITSAIEHHAMLHTAAALEKAGYRVTYLPVDAYGFVSADDLKEAICDDTVLVSIMYINNEIGTRQNIAQLAEICHARGVLFHTDAVQAYGNVKIDVKQQGIDLMSLSAHKIYGPKGIGALYIRKGVRIANFIEGGAQERKRRPGTENVPAIIGFAKAAQMADDSLAEHIAHCQKLRDRLIDGVKNRISYIKLNGHPTERHPGNVNLSFEFIEGESLLLSLDLKGIAASSGSACTSGSLDPSHVLMAIGLTHEIAHGSLRLTIGDFTTEQDVDYTIDVLEEVVNWLRQMSPLYEGVEQESICITKQ